MNRRQERAVVLGTEEIANGIYCVRLECQAIANGARPGQFVNVRTVDGQWGPLLRRPFSIARVDGPVLELIFNVVGVGTRLMVSRREGDRLDLLGPLGVPFGVDGDYDTAILVAGGLGVAPFPFLTAALKQAGKRIVTLVGARTADMLTTRHLEGVRIATDDGSKGFSGTAVALLQEILNRDRPSASKIFGCGPTNMLRALSAAAQRAGVPCELSLEGDMACGIGLCQGCPVERIGGPRKYALVCTDGPTFDCREVVL